MKYRNIIFDLDGTLLNTIEDLTDGVNHVMEMYGYNTYSISQIKSFVGNGIMKLMETAVPNGKENEKLGRCRFHPHRYQHHHWHSYSSHADPPVSKEISGTASGSLHKQVLRYRTAPPE